MFNLKPNILLIVIDSLHADKFYGSKKKTSITPNIDLLITKGIYFTQAITSAPSTMPSIGSIFTSRYPFESTIRYKKNFIFNSHIPNYINRLKNFGYTTYAFITELINYYGFGKLYDKISTYKPNRSLYDGHGDEIVKQLEKGNMAEPWFYYMHLLDLHSYKKFDENEKLKKFHNDKYGINKYEQMVSALDVWIGKILQKINMENTVIILTADHGIEDANYTEKLHKYKMNIPSYKSGLLLKSSTKLGKKTPNFLTPLKAKFKQKYIERRKKILSKKADKELEKMQNLELGPYEKRVIETTVKPTYHVYDERLKVPLFIAGKEIPSNKIIENQVCTIDIFPTIAEIIGLSDEVDIRGRSLIPLIEGTHMDELPVFVESATNHTDSLTSNVIGLRTPKFKYFRDRSDPNSNVNLFNLEHDPYEEKNIASERSETVEKMEDLLLEIKKNGVFQFQETEESIDDEEVKRVTEELKKLGYI